MTWARQIVIIRTKWMSTVFLAIYGNEQPFSPLQLKLEYLHDFYGADFGLSSLSLLHCDFPCARYSWSTMIIRSEIDREKQKMRSTWISCCHTFQWNSSVRFSICSQSVPLVIFFSLLASFQCSHKQKQFFVSTPTNVCLCHSHRLYKNFYQRHSNDAFKTHK